MPIDKATKLAKVLELLKQDTITPKELEGFLVMVIDVIKKTNENFKSLSSENLQKIEDYLTLIKEQHTEILGQIDDKSSQLEGSLNAKIDLCNSLLKEIRDIKAVPGYTPVKGVDYFDGENPKPEDIVPLVIEKMPPTVLDTAEQLRDKLESLEGEERLDAKAIKNLPKTMEKSIIAHSRNLAWYDETTLVIENPTQIKFQGAGVQISQDSNGALIVTVNGGGSSATFEDELMTDSGDHTSFTISFTPTSGTLLVINENTGQAVPTSSYTNTTTTITFNTNQQIDDGEGNLVTPTFRARYSH